jgi:heptosyltransferase-3
MKPGRILVISFKYLGDLVIAVPAMRALKEHFPDYELHVLTAKEAVPVINQIPWITKVWGLPRVRENASFRKSWPVIWKLHRMRFDRSVDFVGNDRGAIVSLLCGARKRLAPNSPKGFLGRRFCYTQTIPEATEDMHEVKRDLHILSAWKIPPPTSLNLELHTNPAWNVFAGELLPDHSILAHVSTSQRKKEWPISHWATLFKLASQAGYRMSFSAGPSQREQELLRELKGLIPDAPILPVISDLSAYLAVLKQADLFVTGDTGPMHFAVGLGVPTISLFGASSFLQWSPFGQEGKAVRTQNCTCAVYRADCNSTPHCMATILPETVFEKIRTEIALQ